MNTKTLPAHGERRTYLRGCRCTPCSDTNYRYMSRYRLERARGTKRRVPSQPARAYAKTLRAAGWTTGQIATAASCAETEISRIIRGTNNTIRADIAARILAAKPSLETCTPTSFVPATGTVRRIQALMAIGHTLTSIADAADAHRSPLGKVLQGHYPTVTVATALSVARVYTQMSKKAGTSQRARNLAKRSGWHGPLAWDDIDDPNAQPETTDSNTVPRYLALAEDGEWLERTQGYSREHAAARLGVTRDNLQASIARARKHQNRNDDLGAAA